MSRSYKDGRGGHSRRWKSHGLRYDAVNTPAQHRFIKRSHRRLERRNNKLTINDDFIYPYICMADGSIMLDISEEFPEYWDYDNYSDNWLFYEMLMDDYDEPEYEDPYDYDYDPWDYDYDYDLD